MRRKRPDRRRKHGDEHVFSIWAADPGLELTVEEVEFGKAIERFKARTGVRFPSWSQVLAVLKEMGYRRTK